MTKTILDIPHDDLGPRLAHGVLQVLFPEGSPFRNWRCMGVQNRTAIVADFHGRFG